MSLARFIADQRTMHQVPHALSCRVLGVSISWFYKWFRRPPASGQQRRVMLDERVAELFVASGGTYGSPRIHADLIAEGARVSVNTVASSMRRQGLAGRIPKRPRGLTKQDKTAPKFPDLLRRDFTARRPNTKWCGDITEIPTGEGRLYLATVIDLCGRRLLAAPMAEHPNAALVADALKMATAVRGGKDAIEQVIFHSDRGSTYTATAFTTLCQRLRVRQSMGRVGSCFDNAAAEAFFSTLEHEVLSRHHFDTKAQARHIITAWCYDFYNTRRRHSSAGLLPPVEYEKIAAIQPDAA